MHKCRIIVVICELKRPEHFVKVEREFASICVYYKERSLTVNDYALNLTISMVTSASPEASGSEDS
jgi:hypothetical protein